MSSYIVLKNQVFTNGEYSLVPIRMEDRYDIMKWRNEQIYHLRQNKPLTLESQNQYFDNVISKLFSEHAPSQILFSFLKHGICIGYGGLVHINWIDRNAEISFIMQTSLEESKFNEIWSQFLFLIEEMSFQDLDLHKIFTYAFDVRPHLYTVFENKGFCKEAILKEHCLFNSKYLDVIIHSKINTL